MKYVGFGSIICLVAGTGSLYYSAHLLYSRHQLAANALSADGVITDFNSQESVDLGKRGERRTVTSAPVVTFTTNTGRVVHISGDAFSSEYGYTLGDHVHVLYPEADPDQAQIDTFEENWQGVLAMGGIGLAFTFFGIGPIVAQVRRRRRDTWLAESGMRTQAQFAGVKHIEAGGRHYWRLQCRWQHPVTQKVYDFFSEPLQFDPAPFVRNDTLAVVVNADNPQQYELDTSFLPQARDAKAAANDAQQVTPSDLKYGLKSSFGIGLPVVIVGIAIVALGVSIWRSRTAFVERALYADGVVTRVLHEQSTFDPEVEFTTVDGRRFKMIGAGSKPATYAIGNHVRVLYEQGHSDTATIYSVQEIWALPLFVGGFGLILVAIGSGLIAASLRKFFVYRRRTRAGTRAGNI